MKRVLAVLLFSAVAFAQSTTAAPAAEKKADAKKEMKCDADMKCCDKKEGKHAKDGQAKDARAEHAKAEHAKMDCCKADEGKEGSMCARKPMKEKKEEKKG